MSDLLVAANSEGVACVAAGFISAAATDAVEQRGRFHIALAGGSTPLAAYEHLAVLEGIPWVQTHIFWGDERCVPPEHPDSNFRAAQTALLVRAPIPLENAHRVRGENEPHAEARRYESLIREVVVGSPPCFDLILLGLGIDGHTASLFPGSEALEESSRLVVAALPPPYAQHTRITFTLPLINAARRVLFLATGGEKASVAAQILEGRGLQLPAGRARLRDGEITWMLDEAAASELSLRLRRAGRRAWAGRTRPAG